MSIDQFPSRNFISTYFGSDLPLTGQMDTGRFSVQLHEEIRRTIEIILLLGPKHLMSSEDRAGNGVSKIIVFAQWKLCDTPDIAHLREAFIDHFSAEILTEKFERELYDEMVLFVLNHQPFATKWWEWFVKDGTIGICLKEGVTPGGNEPRRSLDEIFRT